MKHKMKYKTKSNMDDSFDFSMIPSFNEHHRLLRKDITVSLYEYYLVGEIGEPENYIDLVDALRSANPQDDFIIRIASGGGLLSTASMIMNAITESQANVHGYIESNAGSAASLIFLACDNWSLSEDAELFVHTSSSGNFGKESETYEASVFYRKKIHKMMRNRYAGFLTETEIDQVLKGADFYFDADSIAERLDKYSEYKQILMDIEMQEFEVELEATVDETPPKKKKKLLM